MSAPISQVWTFRSDTSDREYETLLLTDGTTSCNCPGWCRRVDAAGKRSCKHTRAVHMGTADRTATSTHRYAAPPDMQKHVPPEGRASVRPAPGFGVSRRRLRL